MKYTENIASLAVLTPQYMGFIFYPESPRYAEGSLDLNALSDLPASIEKVGVFVNASTENILDVCQKYGIQTIQLHGEETAVQCRELKEKNFTVIKAFSMTEGFDFNLLRPYVGVCDFFLFDTKTAAYGGSGKKFNWDILLNYDNALPFFLSGGIAMEDLEALQGLEGMNIHAIDVNSKFELRPGFKDIEKIKLFKEQLSALVYK